MPSTLSVRRINEEQIGQYAMWVANGTSSTVALPNFQRSSQRAADNAPVRSARAARHASAVQPLRTDAQPQHPHVIPQPVPARQTRRAPLAVRLNRVLRTGLIAMCGLAIFGYGMDVATSNDVGRLQEQARRLNEQNSELSAQLLRAISFQGIQDSVVGRFGLRVPDKVCIVPEKAPPMVPAFATSKHHLPVMSGY